jgi:molybdopterin molybdotransferase
MDGFALRAAETHGESPSTFELVATIAAGSRNPVQLQPGQAARIMTGAPLPADADAVVRFEEVRQPAARTLAIARRVESGENVRLAGEDVRSGDVVLRRGRLLGTSEIGLLAALNRSAATVHRRPRIGILSTGDEVVDVGPELEPGQIRDANAYALAASIAALGAEPAPLGVAADRRSALQAKLAAARSCDLILTSGGVSVGDFDLVKDVLREAGEVDILTVRMKPGKPLAIGAIGGVPILGLPGNPVAAIVSFDQFARPAILTMLGHTAVRLPTVTARLTVDVENRGRRRHFERGSLSHDGHEWIVKPVGKHGSAMLTSLVNANCYIVVYEACDHAAAGSKVTVQVFDAQAALRAPVARG